MENVSTATLIGRRLDRLRLDPSPGGVGRLLRDQGRIDHATPLAQSLGGRTVDHELGSVVVVESTVVVPIDVARLTTLPYSIAEGHPLVCLDLETTGLATAAGTLAFLVGVGIWRHGVLETHQLLLPDHSGERACSRSCRACSRPTAGW